VPSSILSSSPTAGTEETVETGLPAASNGDENGEDENN
jgi:hypothetical protein